MANEIFLRFFLSVKYVIFVICHTNSYVVHPDLQFHFLHSLFQNKLAKALYDNNAECADELAFRKGDIVTVMNQNVAGTSGWWMCSLYGRHGLAPANRLQLLPQHGPTVASSTHGAEKPKLIMANMDDSTQNIYQIPSVPRPSSSQTYERMDTIYKVPSSPKSTSKSPFSSVQKHSTEGPEVNRVEILFFFSYNWISVKKSQKTSFALLVWGQHWSLFLGSVHSWLET